PRAPQRRGAVQPALDPPRAAGPDHVPRPDHDAGRPGEPAARRRLDRRGLRARQAGLLPELPALPRRRPRRAGPLRARVQPGAAELPGQRHHRAAHRELRLLAHRQGRPRPAPRGHALELRDARLGGLPDRGRDLGRHDLPLRADGLAAPHVARGGSRGRRDALMVGTAWPRPRPTPNPRARARAGARAREAQGVVGVRGGTTPGARRVTPREWVAPATFLAISLALALAPTPARGQGEGQGQGQGHPGKPIYDRWCAGCHGVDGRGEGEAAAYMLPRPRDFTRALYQVRTTASGGLPTDADLLRVIDEGMPGTAMPGWRTLLSRSERDALVDYLKTFSRFFGQGEPPQALAFGSAPRASEEVLREGREFYERIECWKCHGQAGRGDGPSAPTQADDAGFPI